MLRNSTLRLVLCAAMLLGATALAGAANLLANPGFDGGPDPWRILSEPGRFEGRWDSMDRAGAADSGSAYVNNVTSETGTNTDAFSQCVPVVAGETYRVAASVFVPSGQPATGSAWVSAFWMGSATCGSFVSGVAGLQSEAEGGWTTLSNELVAPAGARTALVRLGVFKIPSGGSREAFFDDIFFGLAGGASTICVPSATSACIDDRFEIEVAFETSQGGGASGFGAPVSLDGIGIARGVLFWFFSADNPEMLVKVLDGCAINGHLWVFYSAGTNVGLDVTVTDHETGGTWTRSNPDGRAAPPEQDLEAFACS